MKALKKDLQSVLKGLKTLADKTEKLAKKLEALETTQPAKKSRTGVGRRGVKKAAAGTAKKATAIDTLFGIIKKSRKGIDTASLKEKTGFDGRKIRDLIYRLKKQGRIKSVGRGVYLAVK